MTSGSGVKQVLDTIDKQPERVWISAECGPYSPLQSINQRTDAQKADLAEKRKKVLRQYIGASCVYQFCIPRGIHVTWEWAQRCQGWRLPFMQKLMKKYQPYFGTTQGCQVNLRDPKTQKLMHKGWKLMTSHQHLSDLMNIPCSCSKGYTHARCEGGLAGMTALYTKEFAGRVWKAVSQEMTQVTLRREMEGRTSLVPGVGEGLRCVCNSLKEHSSSISCGMCMCQAGVLHTGTQQQQQQHQWHHDMARHTGQDGKRKEEEGGGTGLCEDGKVDACWEEGQKHDTTHDTHTRTHHDSHSHQSIFSLSSTYLTSIPDSSSQVHPAASRSDMCSSCHVDRNGCETVEKQTDEHFVFTAHRFQDKSVKKRSNGNFTSCMRLLVIAVCETWLLL